MSLQSLGAAAKHEHGFSGCGKTPQHHGMDVVLGRLLAVGANHILSPDRGGRLRDPQ